MFSKNVMIIEFVFLWFYFFREGLDLQQNWEGDKEVFHKPSAPYMYSVQFSSVAQSCLTLCNPMNRSTPGFPVNHQLPEFTQTHVHRVGDSIQPSHPLSSPSPPSPTPSQHQGLFQWVNYTLPIINITHQNGHLFQGWIYIDIS